MSSEDTEPEVNGKVYWSRKQNFTLLVASLVGLVGWGVGARAYSSPAAHHVLQKVEKEIRSVITNPEDPKAAVIKVIPYENAAETEKGRLKVVVIRTAPGKIKHVPVEEIEMRADGVSIDLHQLFKEDRVATKRCDKTVVHATVAESNLNTLFANGMHTKDMNLKARFENGKVRITGYWKLFLFKGPIETLGKLVLTRGNTLSFEMESLKINGREAPQKVKDIFMERLNPVVDFNELPFKPKVKSISFKGDKLYVSS